MTLRSLGVGSHPDKSAKRFLRLIVVPHPHPCWFAPRDVIGGRATQGLRPARSCYAQVAEVAFRTGDEENALKYSNKARARRQQLSPEVMEFVRSRESAEEAVSNSNPGDGPVRVARFLDGEGRGCSPHELVWRSQSMLVSSLLWWMGPVSCGGRRHAGFTQLLGRRAVFVSPLRGRASIV